MALVTGLTRINVTDASDESVEFYNMGTGTIVDVTQLTAQIPLLRLFLQTPLALPSQTFVVAAASADDNVSLVAADIEAINISSDSSNQVDLICPASA